MPFFRHATVLCTNKIATGDITLQPATDHNMVSTPGFRSVFGNSEYYDADKQQVILEVVEVSSPTYSLQPYQSLDGTNWHAVGSAITAAGCYILAVKLPLFKLSLDAVSGGGLTITAG